MKRRMTREVRVRAAMVLAILVGGWLIWQGVSGPASNVRLSRGVELAYLGADVGVQPAVGLRGRLGREFPSWIRSGGGAAHDPWRLFLPIKEPHPVLVLWLRVAEATGKEPVEPPGMVYLTLRDGEGLSAGGRLSVLAAPVTFPSAMVFSSFPTHTREVEMCYHRISDGPEPLAELGRFKIRNPAYRSGGRAEPRFPARVAGDRPGMQLRLETLVSGCSPAVAAAAGKGSELLYRARGGEETHGFLGGRVEDVGGDSGCWGIRELRIRGRLGNEWAPSLQKPAGGRDGVFFHPDAWPNEASTFVVKAGRRGVHCLASNEVVTVNAFGLPKSGAGEQSALHTSVVLPTEGGSGALNLEYEMRWALDSDPGLGMVSLMMAGQDLPTDMDLDLLDIRDDAGRPVVVESVSCVDLGRARLGYSTSFFRLVVRREAVSLTFRFAWQRLVTFRFEAVPSMAPVRLEPGVVEGPRAGAVGG